MRTNACQASDGGRGSSLRCGRGAPVALERVQVAAVDGVHVQRLGALPAVGGEALPVGRQVGRPGQALERAAAALHRPACGTWWLLLCLLLLMHVCISRF